MVVPAVALVLTAALPAAGRHVHVVRKTAPGEPTASASNGQPANCIDAQKQPAPCNVQYWGGQVISNVKIHAVFWTGAVDATTRAGIGGFFAALTNSSWIDWMNEYRTDIQAAGGGSGTAQLIGRGVFAGPPITITPSAAASCIGTSQANPLRDTAIQAELMAQIDAGNLPAPDENTLYMVYFPPGCVISDGGANSCVAGGFCAYHGTLTLTLAGKNVFYGVVPDFGPGSGCDVGCGRGTVFQNICSASSHEAGEAITDAEVGVARAFAPPLGWYDKVNAEIGDMCNAVQATITSIADGVTQYTVQQMYSVKSGLCQVTRTDADDFSVFMNPNQATLVAGGTVTVPVHTEVTSGSPPSLSLVVSTRPAGVTASFDVNPIAPGHTTNLQLSASASAAAVRDAVVVVTACAGTGTCPSPGIPAHTAGLLLQVTRSPPPTVALDVPAAASGTLPVSVTATAGAGATLASLSLSVDGVQVATSAASPLAVSWDTTLVANGTHTLAASATDADGGSASVEKTAVVTNEFTIALGPAAGSATIGGTPATFTVSTAAVGGAEPVALTVTGLPAGVQASLDQVSVQAGSSATLTISAPAGTAPVGRTTFAVAATTRSVPAGHRTTADLFVIRAPSAAIVAPAAGTVSGTVTITAIATVDANAGIARVDLKDGDTVVGSGAAAATSVSWDTTRVPNGSHLLTAVVRDGAGNTATSPAVAVVVANASAGGGCSTGGAGALAILGLLAWTAARRRRPQRAPFGRLEASPAPR